MGWNGGGFGHMTFETADGVAAWKAASVSHDQWSDWTDWFETPLAPKFVVEKQLKELRKLHDPKRSGYFVLEEQGPKIDFAFDTGEDTVRDFSGTIAAALRASEAHGARGTFYFLGTAGAEYDFTYKLEIANGHSTMESLNEYEIATIYEGAPYQAFLQRIMEGLGITELLEPVVSSSDPEREALKQKAAAFTATHDKPATNKKSSTVAVSTKASPKQKPKQKAAAAKPAQKKAASKTPPKKPSAKKAVAKKPAKKR